MNGANIDLQNQHCATALHFAGCYNYLDVARLLITHGANVNIQTTNGWTALHSAVNNNSTDVARLLIIHGVNPDIKNNEGKTALSLANQAMKKVIEQALADRKAR